jgi:hypothetical protein
VGTQEASDLGTRLSAWHDAMVAHERRLRAAAAGDACDEECPHAEAPLLWSEALATFGPRAEELIFLRSRAQARRSAGAAGSNGGRVDGADHARRRTANARAEARALSSVASPAAAPEV